MYKKTLLLLLIAFIFSATLHSQPPPGYLGKRAALSLSVSSFPAFRGPTQNNRSISSDYQDQRFGESENGLAFNYEFDLEFTYAVGRIRALSLSLGQYYTGVVTETTTPSRNNPFSSSLNNTDRHELFNRLNVRSIGLTYQKYNDGKGALAPMGTHWSVGLKYLFVNSEIVDKRTDYGEPFGQLFGHAPLDIPNTAGFLALKIGVHNTQIFWDRVLFKTGVRIGFLTNPFYISYLGSDNARDVYAIDVKEPNVIDFDFPAYKRLFSHEIFRFDIGVGLLLF